TSSKRDWSSDVCSSDLSNFKLDLKLLIRVVSENSFEFILLDIIAQTVVNSLIDICFNVVYISFLFHCPNRSAKSINNFTFQFWLIFEQEHSPKLFLDFFLRS